MTVFFPCNKNKPINKWTHQSPAKMFCSYVARLFKILYGKVREPE